MDEISYSEYIRLYPLDGYHFIALPFWIVRTNKSPKQEDLQAVLLWTIRRGLITSTLLSSIFTIVSCGIFLVLVPNYVGDYGVVLI